MFEFSRRRVLTVIAVAGSLAALGAPAVAVAKPKPLTKAQVIKLIKHYSKPGPPGSQGPSGGQGPKGDTGPAGSYTIGKSSGLSQSGNSLSLDPGLLRNCPGYELMTGLNPAGSLGCKYEPTSDMYMTYGGYTSGSGFGLNVPQGIGLQQYVATTIATTPAVGVAGMHLVSAVIQLGPATSGSTLDLCELDQKHGTTLTSLQVEETEAAPYTTLDFQGLEDAAVGDTFSVQCSLQQPNGGSGAAGGNIISYLVNN
jgi:hypothetical protein